MNLINQLAASLSSWTQFPSRAISDNPLIPASTKGLMDLRFIGAACAIYYTTILILPLFVRKSDIASDTQDPKDSKGSQDKPKGNDLVKYAAIAHNIFLSLLSLCMFIGIGSSTYSYAAIYGESATFCTHPSDTALNSVSTNMYTARIQYWLYIFYLSKFYELLDTLILVLRGKPLTLLHVWHHSSVLVETWSWVQFHLVYAVYGMMFNTFVHVIMYMYFAVSLMENVNVPAPIRRSITWIQIVQFISSFVISIPYVNYYNTVMCLGIEAFAISCVCNASYLLLFIRFYRRTYNAARAGPKPKPRPGPRSKTT